jgi:hypothetical protein
MICSRLYNCNHVRKIFALLAAILILPLLAPAYGGNGQGQNGNGNGQGQNGNGNGQGQNGGGIPSAPEVNTGIVLIPFVGAVLVFSAFQLLRAKAAQKKP